VLPQYGLEDDPSDVLALQTFDDSAGERALLEDVAGGGYEESQCLQSSVSWRAGRFGRQDSRVFNDLTQVPGSAVHGTCMRISVPSASRAVAQPLEISVPQLGLARAHRHRVPADEDALCQRGHFERIPTPEHEIRRPAHLERSDPVDHTEDRGWIPRQRCESRILR